MRTYKCVFCVIHAMSDRQLWEKTWKTEFCQWANMCDILGVFSPSFEMQHPGLHFYYGTCHSNLSLFSSLQKVPQKIQGYFLQNYIATMVLILLFIQNSSPTLWNIGAKKTRQKKLKTCSTADVPSCRVKLHLSITSFVSPPHNLGCTRTQTFLSLSYHLKVTRTEESRRSEKYVGETLI